MRLALLVSEALDSVGSLVPCWCVNPQKEKARRMSRAR
jgi:hypothetical protein